MNQNREFEKWSKVYDKNLIFKKKLQKIDFNNLNQTFFDSFFNLNSPYIIGKYDIGYNNFNKISLSVFAKVFSNFFQKQRNQEKDFIILGHDGSKKLKNLVFHLANALGSNGIHVITMNENKEINSSFFDYSVKKLKNYCNLYFKKLPNSKYIILKMTNSEGELPTSEFIKFLKDQYDKQKFSNYFYRESIIWKLKESLLWKDFQEDLFKEYVKQNHNNKLLNVAIISKNKGFQHQIEKIIGNYDIQYTKTGFFCKYLSLIRNFFLNKFKKVDLLIESDLTNNLPIFYVKTKYLFEKIKFSDLFLLLLYFYIYKNNKEENYRIFKNFYDLDFLKEISKKNNVQLEELALNDFQKNNLINFHFNDWDEIFLNYELGKKFNIFGIIISVVEILNYLKTQNSDFFKFKDQLKKMFTLSNDFSTYFHSSQEFKTILEHFSKKGITIQKEERNKFDFFDLKIKFNTFEKVNFYLYVNSKIQYYKLTLISNDLEINLEKNAKNILKELK